MEDHKAVIMPSRCKSDLDIGNMPQKEDYRGIILIIGPGCECFGVLE
jgi:hypothetical protein